MTTHNNLVKTKANTVVLPQPDATGKITLEKAIKERKSIREYKKDTLKLKALGQLLWAAQGITHNTILRAAPSAGALYPLELYIVAQNVENLEPGVYKYVIREHSIIKIKNQKEQVKPSTELCDACLEQSCIQHAPCALVMCGVFSKTEAKYGAQAQKYVHMEVGCVAQNIYLQTGALELGTVFVGAFDEKTVAQIIGAKNNEVPLCVMPIGNI